MGGTRFMVQWEEHPSHLATRLGQLLEHQTLVDVTLMCNTHTLRVHRAVLAACSPYFETILQRQLGMHPLIVLKDMQFSVLKSLIEFMYCGETSVTEDNLGALLQAAKFFQVKGLSAMTKEALGLVPNTKSTINGDAARKAFVGRPKRVGMQQTLVTSGLKTLPASHASSSHANTAANELPTLPTKTTFQTISKPISSRPDTQQQTDTAQLLLSLSGSEFPKQTFHTVSKNVRFQHNVSGSTTTVESPRSSIMEGNLKTKEVVGRIPVMTTNGGKSTTVAAATTATAASGAQQGPQMIEHPAVAPVRDDVLVSNPQSVYLAEGHRRRGRPVKRPMNMLIQERVMTDADAALHKEAEASRKALEMLRQEMSSEAVEANAAPNMPVPVSPAAVAPSTASTVTNVSNLVQIGNVAGEHVQKGVVKHQGGTKLQVQSVQTPVATTSRTLSSQNTSNPLPTKRTNANTFKTTTTTTSNTVFNAAAKKNLLPVSSLPSVENTNNSVVNTITKVEEGDLPQQMFELSNDAVQETPKEDGGENVESESDASRNSNIIYQMADSNNASAGSVMSQYMEVLKEAGLPTDVPILLDSGDGSYVTVNEEVLMNIVNGGVLQCHVTEGNFVAGDGVEFIVQEITEDEMEAVQAQVQEQSGEETLPKAIENNADVSSIENHEGASDVKLPVEEGAALASECSETQELKATELLPETSQSKTERMETESDVLCGDGTVNEESLKSRSEPADGCGEENLINSAIVSDSKTCNELGNQNQIDAKTECNSESFVKESTNHEVNFESHIMSTVLAPEEDRGNLKTETSDEMSVEQALQAMMGESSDTEMESCAQIEEKNTVKEENVVTDLETMTHSYAEEKSENLHLVLHNEGAEEEEREEEEEEEDLRLVLSSDSGEVAENKETSVTASEENTNVMVQENLDGNVVGCESVEEAELQSVKQEMAMEESVSKSPILENEFGSVADHGEDIEQVIEPLQVESISKEVHSPLSCGTESEVNFQLKMADPEELEPGDGREYIENIPVCEISGDSQEVSQLTSSSEDPGGEAASLSAIENPKPKGAIISPSKDIPFAVGLLPLKTALEKLQAMPEYHPRKTRSSSTGKESAPDMPAARVKRKASSSDGAEKKMKLSSGEEGTIMDNPIPEEVYGGDTTMEVVASSLPQERMEDTVLSMPELMTDPTEG